LEERSRPKKSLGDIWEISVKPAPCTLKNAAKEAVLENFLQTAHDFIANSNFAPHASAQLRFIFDPNLRKHSVERFFKAN
jgi:hypothetical protein